MRSYPRNSPQASARIVALAMMADGRLHEAEIETFQRMAVCARLGLSSTEFQDVVHDLCEDFLDTASQQGSTTCELPPDALAAILDDIEDPHSREELLALCAWLMEADGRIDRAESVVMTAAVSRWNLRRFAAPAGECVSQP